VASPPLAVAHRRQPRREPSPIDASRWIKIQRITATQPKSIPVSHVAFAKEPPGLMEINPQSLPIQKKLGLGSFIYVLALDLL